jgi:ribose/xylose/arabinose/galactoside ABC-type transport system permease subunit
VDAKRAVPNTTRSASSSNHAIANALLVGAALFCGIALLVQRGRLIWPPYQLLASLSTLAGCLALVGPVILLRSGEIDGSLGELMWLTAGLLVWFFDIEAVAQGRWRTLYWATPLHDHTLGLAILAVLLAGWRCGLANRNWSWTNVTGWILSTFWVGMTFCSWFLTPAARAGLAAR